MIDEEGVRKAYEDILWWVRNDWDEGSQRERIRANERIKILKWILEL